MSAFGNVGYGFGSGTSLATPLVAGATAVLLSAHPTWTPMMVREALMKTASQSNSPNNDYGYGIINIWEAINIDTLLLDGKTIPGEFELYQNYPNPFNANTTIEYDLKTNTRVEIKIFNILGKKVITLVNNIESPGRKSISWNGTDQNGNPVGTSVYFYTLVIDEATFTKKMLLIK